MDPLVEPARKPFTPFLMTSVVIPMEMRHRARLRLYTGSL